MSNVRIGTSGWHYDDWRGPFYPPATVPGDFLARYAERFDCVEVNNSFYRLPSAETVRGWARATPGSFRFAVKASRYTTHMKKLKDGRASSAKFFAAIAPLRTKLGPVLFQLPPSWRVDRTRLAEFLDQLPPRHRYAFEFRDPSWHVDPILALLREHGAAFCLFDLAGARSPVELTADFAYVRLHGPSAAYRGSYDGRALFGWARRFEHWRAAGIEVWCFFDNDQKAAAPRDAARLKAMVAGH